MLLPELPTTCSLFLSFSSLPVTGDTPATAADQRSSSGNPTQHPSFSLCSD
ncbi:hypothetical protein HanXRQr2_Chr13g0610351 [Helianthus annuus]|uniref:Uncharacterized protein n=1 Tax=Helianthus annuus TaxID=4232 RepID=A0A251SXU8_HELAN|nr:hypothetical protein HanXRQr2_Chr13g0610351 [Helianthus annuus]KAJ0483218.1 hypothetical protein HanIR_Chr13g0662501 [Helianthus annuus]